MIVNVDIDQINNTIKKVKTYLSNNKNDIKKITSNIQNSKEYWEGEDQKAFEKTWQDNCRSITNMDESIESYVSFLEYSSSQYSNLQSRVKNRAKLLPK